MNSSRKYLVALYVILHGVHFTELLVKFVFPIDYELIINNNLLINTEI